MEIEKAEQYGTVEEVDSPQQGRSMKMPAVAVAMVLAVVGAVAFYSATTTASLRASADVAAVTDCGPGYFKEAENCDECHLGMFQGKENFDGGSCTVCPGGTYVDHFAASECIACPAGKTTCDTPEDVAAGAANGYACEHHRKDEANDCWAIPGYQAPA